MTFDKYIGSEVSFPTGSGWKLETKIHEHSYFEFQEDCDELEARGVFLCSKVLPSLRSVCSRCLDSQCPHDMHTDVNG